MREIDGNTERERPGAVEAGMEGARRATGMKVSTAPSGTGPLAPGQRWTASRKREVVLRILRGEPLEALSRELSVEVHLLDKWHQKALGGLEKALQNREGEPLQIELDEAMKKIGELSMEVELLREKDRQKHPLPKRRSRR